MVLGNKISDLIPDYVRVLFELEESTKNRSMYGEDSTSQILTVWGRFDKYFEIVVLSYARRGHKQGALFRMWDMGSCPLINNDTLMK